MWFVIFGSSGLSLALAALFPETSLSLVMGWITALLYVFAVRREERLVWGWYCSGLVFHAMAFYWLPKTLVFFGGFPWAVAVVLFILFCLLSSLQFALCGWLCARFLSSALARLGLALPFAWLVTEALFPRMFPWALVHSQTLWTGFAGLAEYGGVYPLGALMLLWVQRVVVLLERLRNRKCLFRWDAVALVCLSAALVVWSEIRLRELEIEVDIAPSLTFALVQGNLEAKSKGDVRYFDANLDTYRELSKKVVHAGAQVVLWPEAVVNYWMPEGAQNVRLRNYDPWVDNAVPLLYGGLSFRRIFGGEERETKRFNSAIGISPEGNIQGVYHKKVLMPFGEYIPLADRFPVLKSLSPQTGDFDKGEIDEPIRLPIANQEDVSSVALAPLVCYEDLIPSLARDAARRGAQVLVNLTNDAWYGDTAAPHQHHFLALWRAIETRRALLRVTNTGFTAVVDPLGRTTARLPLFSQGALVEKVPLMNIETFYVRFGDWPLRVVLIIGLLVGFFVRSSAGQKNS